MARVYIKVSARDIRSAVQRKGVKNIIALTKNPAILKQIGEEAIRLLEPYIPEDTGNLIDKGHVVYHEKQVQLSWGTKYASYQFNGKIYGPNFLIKKGKLAGQWRSPKNKPKYDTGRTLNYTKSTARPHWTDEVKPGGAEFEKLVAFAEPLIKKEVQKNGR
jgi:hypothetical protein